MNRLQNLNPSTKDIAHEVPERKVVVLVPICNPGNSWAKFISALLIQRPMPDACVVIDSASTDGADRTAQAAGLLVQRIERAAFNHGATRQIAIEQHANTADFVVFLTQDAILTGPESLDQLIRSFDDPTVAAAYGRQLPHPEATALAAHARLFNYPAQSHTSRLSDISIRGIKTCFLSNSFAAYRVSVLQELGGFSGELIIGEDTHLAARLIHAGYAIRYQAEATVYHSHNYSLLAEFQRYFDTGVFHAQQRHLLATFGGAGREGLRFVLSEVKYIFKHAPWRLPEAACRTCIKALAYRLGKKQARLPMAMRRYFSMTKGYWV